MNNFEKAAKLKLRFMTAKGSLAAEDLFDLSLTSLDTLAKGVNKLLRDEGEESFLPDTTNKPVSHNGLKLEILKHVIAAKVEERDARENRAQVQAKIAKLKELAEAKTNEQLASQSLEDIQKQLAELGASLV